jgi:hypothetical protein
MQLEIIEDVSPSISCALVLFRFYRLKSVFLRPPISRFSPCLRASVVGFSDPRSSALFRGKRFRFSDSPILRCPDLPIPISVISVYQRLVFCFSDLVRSSAMTAISAIPYPLLGYPTASQDIPDWRGFHRCSCGTAMGSPTRALFAFWGRAAPGCAVPIFTRKLAS